MIVEIRIPDQVYNEDPTYVSFFKQLQAMVDRMSVSHFKYGPIHSNATADLGNVDEFKNGLQRLSMYNSEMLDLKEVWKDRKRKTLNTGNTENLLDAANFFIIESLFPRHDKAHFRAQTSTQSPGLDYIS
jgi:hypothetical protein